MKDALVFIFPLLFLFAAFWAIGYGVVRLTFRKARPRAGLLTAPALGFGLTVLVGGFLTLHDVPVKVWALPWTLLGAGFSLGVHFWVRNPAPTVSERDRWFKSTALCLTLAAALLLLPVLTGGGLRYTLFRGNGYDGLNYLTAAGFLQHEPFSSRNQPDSRLLDRHPAYLQAKRALAIPWVTPCALAYAAALTGTPVVDLEYVFLILCLLLAGGPLFAVGRSLGLSPGLTGLAVGASLVGFWPGFLMDIRAEAHLCSIPVFCLLLALWIAWETPDQGEKSGASTVTRPVWKTLLVPSPRAVVAGLLVGVLCLLYAEFTPVLAGGAALWWAWRELTRRSGLAQRAFFIQLAFVALVCLALFHFRPIRWLLYQKGVIGVGHVTDWHLWFFPWLFTDPVPGFWGLSYLSQGYEVPAFFPRALLRAGFWGLGLACFALLFWALARAFLRDRPLARRMSRASWPVPVPYFFVAAGLVLSLHFLASGQKWVAAKAVSYVIVLVPLLLFAAFGSATGRSGRPLRQKAACCLLIAWAGAQVYIAAARSVAAARERDYPYQTIIQRAYRQFDWDWRALAPVLTPGKPSRVWVATADSWAAWYLYFRLGWDHRVTDLGRVQVPIAPEVRGMPDSSPWNRQRPAGCNPFPPDFLVLQKPYAPQALQRLARAENRDYCLLAAADLFRTRPFVLGVFRRTDSADPTPPEARFLLDADPRHVLFYAPTAGIWELRIPLAGAPSVSGDSPAELADLRTGTRYPGVRVGTALHFAIPADAGLNEAILTGPPLTGPPLNGPARPKSPLAFSIDGITLIGPLPSGPDKPVALSVTPPVKAATAGLQRTHP